MKRPPRTHLFIEDVEAMDPRTRTQYCLRCGLPSDNQVHALPRRGEDERAHEARRMGEPP